MLGAFISRFEGDGLNMALVSTSLAKRMQRDDARGFWLAEHPESTAPLLEEDLCYPASQRLINPFC